MKRLTLLRHAKSGDDGMALRDFDRPLNAKGRRAARAIGRHMRDTALRFDAVLASPATRVAETLQEVESGYGAALPPRWERRIYLASPGELLDVVHGAPAEAESLLLVGHNPGLEQLVLMLVPPKEDGSVRGEVAIKYPTASLAELTFAVDRWEDVEEDKGELVRFVRPRDLDPEARPRLRMSEAILRRAVAADAARLALLGGATFLHSFAHDHPGDAIVAHVDAYHSPGWYARVLADPACAAWILETALGAPVGYALLTPPQLDCATTARDLELKRIYLLGPWQSGGWGAQLLDAVEAEARRRGAERLLLCVYSVNEGAQRFYARRGYRDTGFRQCFMVGDAPFEDFIWAKPLA